MMTKTCFLPSEQGFYDKIACLQSQSTQKTPTIPKFKVVLFGGAIEKRFLTEQKWKIITMKIDRSTSGKTIDKVNDSNLSQNLSQKQVLGCNSPFWILSEV